MEVNTLVLTLPPVLGDKALCLGPRNLMLSISKVKLNLRPDMLGRISCVHLPKFKSHA